MKEESTKNNNLLNLFFKVLVRNIGIISLAYFILLFLPLVFLQIKIFNDLGELSPQLSIPALQELYENFSYLFYILYLELVIGIISIGTLIYQKRSHSIKIENQKEELDKLSHIVEDHEHEDDQDQSQFGETYPPHMISMEIIKEIKEVIPKHEHKSNLIDAICSIIANKIGASIIAYFDVDQEKNLFLVGGFGYPLPKNNIPKIEKGEGLTGQAVLSQEPRLLKDLPEDLNLKVISGLGEASPRSLFLYPVKDKNQVIGIFEIGSFGNIPIYNAEFMDAFQKEIVPELQKKR
jgi:hypothetical protein